MQEILDLGRGAAPVNYTDVPTIYKRKLATVTFRIAEDLKPRYNPDEVVSSPEDCYRIAHAIFRTLDEGQEHMVLLVLSSANNVTGFKVISSGSVNSSIVHPTMVFRAAIMLNAVGIILVHNHPSGNTTVSREDIVVTRQLIEAGRIIGITVHDHLILAGDDFVSLKQEGHM